MLAEAPALVAERGPDGRRPIARHCGGPDWRERAAIRSLELLGMTRNFLEFLDLYKAFYKDSGVLGGPGRS